MMKNVEEFIKEIEPKLNERDKKVRERKELIKDINDFCDLLPALSQVIEELQKQYDENNNLVNVKEELDSYLKERDLYWQTINEFRIRAEKLEQEIEKTEELDFYEKMVDKYYKRHEILVELKRIEAQYKESGNSIQNENNEVVSISNNVEYENTLQKLNELDKEIEEEYKKILEYEKNDDLEEDIDFSIQVRKTSNIYTKEHLEEEQNKILEDLKKIEQEKGKKCLLKYSFKGENHQVQIPKRLRGKYCALLTKLYQTEKHLQEFIPPVIFESDLYEKMTKEQKLAYLANLLLQIEARKDKTVDKYEINGKVIPFEYKELYLEVLNYIEIEKMEPTFSIDIQKSRDIKLEEQVDYPYLKSVNFEKENMRKIQEAYRKHQVVVTNKRTAKKKEKIKKNLKKKIVAIALTVGAVAVTLTASINKLAENKSNFETQTMKEDKINPVKTEEISIEINNDITPSNMFQNTTHNIKTINEEINTDWKDVNYFSLTPNEGETVNIYKGDLKNSFKPKYPNDSYRIVARNYRMPSGEIIKITNEDELAKEKMLQLEQLGGVLETIDAVAKTGEEDYAKNKIPTGQFMIDNNLSPNSIELDNEVLEYLNNNEGRGR